jgi:hypothetical protein
MTYTPETPPRARSQATQPALASESTKSSDHRTAGFVLLTAAIAAAWTMFAWRGPVTSDLAFWFVTALLSELLWIRLPMGQATLSMASCAQYAAVLLLPRGQVMAVAASSVAIVESVVMRKPLRRVVFNSAQAALATGAASLVLSGFGGGAPVLHDPAAGTAPLALLLVAIVYFTINSGAVSIAVALAEGTSPLAAWRRNFGNPYELLSSGALFSLGALFASYYLHAGPVGAFLIVCPMVLAFQGYRLHSLHRREQAPGALDTRRPARPELTGPPQEVAPRWDRSA